MHRGRTIAPRITRPAAAPHTTYHKTTRNATGTRSHRPGIGNTPCAPALGGPACRARRGPPAPAGGSDGQGLRRTGVQTDRGSDGQGLGWAVLLSDPSPRRKSCGPRSGRIARRGTTTHESHGTPPVCNVRLSKGHTLRIKKEGVVQRKTHALATLHGMCLSSYQCVGCDCVHITVWDAVVAGPLDFRRGLRWTGLGWVVLLSEPTTEVVRGSQVAAGRIRWVQAVRRPRSAVSFAAAPWPTSRAGCSGGPSRGTRC